MNKDETVNNTPPQHRNADGKVHPSKRLPFWKQGWNSIISNLTTIRFRLVLWYVATTAVLLIISGGLLYTTLAQFLQQSNQNTEAQLALTGQQIALEATRNNGTLDRTFFKSFFSHNPESAQKLYSLADGTIIMVVSEDGQVQASLTIGAHRSNTQQIKEPAFRVITTNNTEYVGEVCTLIPISSAEKGSTVYDEKGAEIPLGQGESVSHYRMCRTMLLSPQGQHAGTIVIAQPYNDEQILQRLILNLALVIPAILFILAVGGYWVISRTMRPVHMIAQTARQIGKTDLSKRIALKSRDELGELAATFDSMLGRLESLFEHQRRFTADASHELRTPLTVMNVAVNQALETRTRPENYEQALSQLEKDERALLTVRDENEHMTRLVNNLLLLARADTGQHLLEKEELDLSEIALDVAERLTPLAKDRQIDISLGELPELPVEGDRNYLTSMVINLIENAVKYTASHGSRVHIESGRGTGAQEGWGWIAIEDNGPGIEPHHVAHIFERFYRIMMTRSEQSDTPTRPQEAPRGSGLGLSIVQWIAQAHGGRICLESTSDKGARFEVWLPLIKTE